MTAAGTPIEFAIGAYDGPALALVDELALLKIEGGAIAAAKFCSVETGLSFIWRSYHGRFNVLRRGRVIRLA